ncbi:MAG: CBS domain-containing protein [Archaeoglobaceae archaeon]|nr:CBS domain-containing protein [Archaeoglobaceae archaeon]MCX8151526.1 CBS domain-containing protein [Archaeoglobaceae archaeon]MDW8013238.1 CBS domain-containing protein [Archaeoglobaceae archaeon]
MRWSFKLFNIAGIEVRVHLSTVVIISLLFYGFYISPPPFGFANLEGSLRLLFSIAASFLIVVAIVIHELAHSFAARHYGVKVNGVVVFIFGGIAMMEEIPREPRKELIISFVGPVSSFAVALMSFIASLFIFSQLFVTFGYINILLALFNSLPAFPMDGGRILRSILAARMSYARATKVAADLGRGLAIVMAIFGIFYNPWLILIALFIYIGASEEERIVMFESVLGKVKLRDIMTTQLVTVKPDNKVEEVVKLMLKFKHLGYPVVESGKLLGIVTLSDLLKADPREEVSKVMSKNIISLSPDATAFDAFKVMSEKNIGRILIIEDNKLVGIVTRSDIMKAKEILEALEVFSWRRG